MDGLSINFDIAAERAVIAAMLREPGRFKGHLAELEASDFSPSWRPLFWAVQQAERAGPIDPVTVAGHLTAAARLQLGDGEALKRMAAEAGNLVSVDAYVAQIRERSAQRALAELDASVLRDESRPVSERIHVMRSMLDAIEKRQGGYEPADGMALARTAMRMLEQREQMGVETGFRALDKALGALRPGRLYVLAARPGLGKSALTLAICTHVGIDLGLPALMVSLEMTQGELVFRILAARGNILGDVIEHRALDAEDWAAASRVLARLSESKLRIDDRPRLSMREIAATAMRLHAREPLALVAIDYVTRIRTELPKAPRHEQVAADSDAAKTLARELKVPVLLCSQFNRAPDAREGPPRLSDLRDSGAIEQDADAVLALYRPETMSDSEAEVHVLKQRAGWTGSLKLGWDAPFTRFRDWDDRAGRRTTTVGGCASADANPKGKRAY